METTTAAINKLPREILCLILSKLPLDNVCVCRGVLKSWNQLIQQPYFINLHRSVSPLAITVVYQTLVDKEYHTVFGFAELSSSSTFQCYTLNVPDKVVNIPRLEFAFVGSCNGLICLTSYDLASYDDEDHYKLVLCNPMLGTHFFLPDPPFVELGDRFLLEFGFGYIPSVGQYKVIMIAYASDQRRPVSYVCTVQCGRNRYITPQAWRETTSIVDGLVPILYGLYPAPVFFHGSIYWLAELCIYDEKSFCLICFDVEKELLQTLSLPPNITGANLGIGVYYDHEGIDHFYICEEMISCTNIWVMETYECVESSRMRFKWQGRIKWVIQVPDIETSPLKLFKVFEDGKLLISIEKSELAHYDPSTGIMETLDSVQFPVRFNELALDTCML